LFPIMKGNIGKIASLPVNKRGKFHLTRFRMQRLIILVLVCGLALSCGKEMPEPGANLLITYTLIPGTDALSREGWGYEIFVNYIPVIRQEHIPAIGGIRVFKTTAHATRVANLVIQKIRNNSGDLPAVSIQELARLGTINLNELYAETYRQPTGGWGVTILLEQIPLSSYDYFPDFGRGLPTEADAEKVGAYAIMKLRQQYEVPEITAAELKLLKIR
jgi:hypothetical protein